MNHHPEQLSNHTTNPHQQLKTIKKQIHKLKRKRDANILQLKRQTIRKFIHINKKSQMIISGQDNFYANYHMDGDQAVLDNVNSRYDTQPNENQIKSVHNQGIKCYWRGVFEAQYFDNLKIFDLELLSNLQSVELLEYTAQTIKINFVFKSNHKSLTQGTYQRTINRDENGNVYTYKGNRASNSNQIRKGLIKILLCSREQQNLPFLSQLFQILSTQLIPNSLLYFLKTRWNQLQLQITNTKNTKQRLHCYDTLQ